MQLAYISAAKTYIEKLDKKKYVMHTHSNYEIYCFLQGKCYYTVEGTVYPLEKGDIILMRKGEAHYLLPDPEKSYERIVINFDFDNFEDIILKNRLLAVFNDRPLGKYNRYPAELFENFNWIYYLEKICNSKDKNSKLIYLLVLLEELYQNFETVKNETKDQQSNNSLDVIKYINRHLTDDLSLDKICNRFFISKSQLNRNFKKANGCTVWEYITTKRLLLAKEYLQKGEKPTEIYPKCGFRDYVTFYKAYKKFFSVSPKNDSVSDT